MAEQAKHPFEEYTLYVVLHKKEGRRMANLVKNKDNRTTISYARYLMSVHCGRILEKAEHVDHINNNKLDDRIENLQILTKAENNIKQAALKPAKIIDMLCPVCKNSFMFDMRNIKFRPNPTCSKSCGAKKKFVVN